LKKAKVITALALTVVMLVVMTGLAAADDEYIVPSDSYPKINIDHTPTTVTLSISDFRPGWTAGQIHTISATTTAATNGGATTDLEYMFTHGTTNSSWLNSGATWNWTDTSDPDTVTLQIRVKPAATPPVGAMYDIRLNDQWTDANGNVDLGAITIFGSAIPEFVTIALPALSILGLFLFYSHRKRKEE